ncbi:hypothetical protein DOM21_15935 [Bacteriovorax stolpii]|uniref:Uncharacterized protein n=1 Tax=Bacteriovorax stolpii TaxID=960 RepID=A0A2K9NNS7_BACTC|nr:hypothetical protein [Bacteriovorax stolpii]AUN97147.1 hypothetical protein C0V70_03290 [Bacteriovorax stolpii]QDK42914.1 hypothetical protein DOM21_15935 [Bacteriovorax stolpii]TDP53433.1 hypothetical protein C8D79_2077 [Bacteriovorax stolpii]
MKALTIVAALALTSGSAMALDTVMGLKGRFDYVRTETDNNPGKDSSGVLTTSYLRLVTDAKLNDTMTAKLTLDFQEADSSKDNGLTNLVDEAFLTKTFGYGFSAMVGKQAVLTGGHENEYSSRDIYTTSIHNDSIADYLTGVTVGYAVAEQNIYLQYMQREDSKQTPFTDKKVVGAAYYGSFMNKMIEPVLSYHKQGTTRAAAYDTFMSAGLRLNVAQFTVEADYLVLEQEKLTAAGDAKLKSIVALVRYNHENFKPFAKFIKEDGEKGFDGIVTGSNESERTAWELGLEYVPNKDEDFRYHVVYSSSESKQTKPAPTSKVEEQKIYAGIAFNYNILK